MFSEQDACCRVTIRHRTEQKRCFSQFLFPLNFYRLNLGASRFGQEYEAVVNKFDRQKDKIDGIRR